MSFISKLFKDAFNPANIFLIVIVTFVLIFSIIRVQYSHELEQNVVSEEVIRVLDESNSSYYAWSKSRIYELKTDKKLQIGYVYRIISKLHDFSTTTYDKYKKSLGLAGVLQILDIKSHNSNCDLVCNFFQAKVSFKNYVFWTFDDYYCRQIHKINTHIYQGIKCHNLTGLSMGLLIGDVSMLDSTSKDLFKFFGLTHLIAVSGFQVVMVMSFMEGLGTRLMISRSTRLYLIIVAIIALVFLVGPQPPVLRSSISLFISQSVLTFFGRKVSALRSLLYSGLLMLIVNPGYLNNLSFQLSFLASFGLVMSINTDFKGLNLIAGNLLQEFLGVVFTFLYTLPIVIQINKEVSLFGLLFNVAVLPTIPILSLSLLVGLIPFIGSLFLFFSSLALSFIFGIMNYTAPYLNSIEFELSSYGVTLYYFSLVIINYMFKIFKASYKF